VSGNSESTKHCDVLHPSDKGNSDTIRDRSTAVGVNSEIGPYPSFASDAKPMDGDAHNLLHACAQAAQHTHTPKAESFMLVFRQTASGSLTDSEMTIETNNAWHLDDISHAPRWSTESRLSTDVTRWNFLQDQGRDDHNRSTIRLEKALLGNAEKVLTDRRSSRPVRIADRHVALGLSASQALCFGRCG
jgi:hypothetical protein